MELVLSDEVLELLVQWQSDRSMHKVMKAIEKTLKLIETNLRHPSLNTHKFKSLKGPHGEEVFEAYAQQKTPGAYRIFFYYGPNRNQISIVHIMAHPD